jgi:AcrR family transcriptional regulator
MATSRLPEPSRFAEAAISRGLNDRYVAAAGDIERLVAAAYRLIEREGSVDLKMRELLAEADVSTQNFYRYFATKDEFFIVLLEDGQHRLLGYLNHQLAHHTEPRRRMQALIEGILAQAEDPEAANRTRPFLVHKARLNQERARLGQDMNAGLLALVTREVEAARKAAGSPTTDVVLDAEFAQNLIMAVMERHILDTTVPTAREKKALLAFCIRALQI